MEHFAIHKMLFLCFLLKQMTFIFINPLPIHQLTQALYTLWGYVGTVHNILAPICVPSDKPLRHTRLQSGWKANSVFVPSCYRLPRGNMRCCSSSWRLASPRQWCRPRTWVRVGVGGGIEMAGIQKLQVAMGDRISAQQNGHLSALAPHSPLLQSRGRFPTWNVTCPFPPTDAAWPSEYIRHSGFLHPINVSTFECAEQTYM